MSNESNVVQCPDPVETAELHFKTLSRLKVFDVHGVSFEGNTNLLAVSQYFGLVFVGTSNGFLILKSKTVFSTTKPDEFSQREIILNSQATHLAVNFDQKHLAVGCLAKMGPMIYVYNISTFLTKGVIPVKTIPLSKPFQNPLCELMWQPNSDSALTVCFADGSVSSLNLFQGTGNDIFTLPNTTQARCLCWSPKGKQLVIGSGDGALSQYKPDLKFVKKLHPPPIFNGAVTIVNLLWISSFQFIAGYKDGSNAAGFPFIIMVVNAQKNEPIKFINYDDITYSSVIFRAHQVYFHHQSAWNLIYVASANSVEVAVLHAKEDNTTWEQWLLGDASRAELPLNSDKVETYPLGLTVDYTSDQPIPWGEDSLPPMPRLLLLSSEGVLTTFNIVNTSSNAPQLCSPPKEAFDDSWFTMKQKINDPNEAVKIISSPTPQTNPPEVSKPVTNLPAATPFSILGPAATVSSEEVGSSGFAAFKIQPPKPQEISQQSHDQKQQQPVPAQPAISNVFSTPNSSGMWAQKPTFSFAFSGTPGLPTAGESISNLSKTDTEIFKSADQSSSISLFGPKPAQKEEETKFLQTKENVEVKKPPTTVEKTSSPLPATGDRTKSGPIDQASDVKNASSKTPDTSPGRGTPDLATIDESVYIGALLEEIDHFNGEMKELLSRVSNLTINIGAEDEKMNLRKSIEKVSDFEKGLNETTSSQKNEIQALKADVIEAFAWLEDARSRNRQRKSPTFIELKKLEDLDPMSSVLMGEIGHLKYYIENQLKQLYSYLMKELMVHQDSCRYYVKSMMTIPSMEELYKTLYLELKILSEERSIVEDLRRQIAEKSKKGRMQTSLLKSGGEYSKTTTNDRVSELFKLAENLLQIRIDHDEDVNDICVTDAFQLMVKNQINAIAERLKKFTEEKESILRDVFSEREIMKTRSIKSTFGSSSFVRNTSSRIISKYSVAAKMSDREKLQKGKPSGTAETDSSLSQEKTSSSTCENCRPSNRGKFVTSEPTCEAFPVTSREPVKSIFSIATPQQSAVDKEKEKPAQTFTFSLTKPASTVAGGEGETAKSGSGIAKTAPFVFKAPTISTMPAAVTPAAKSTAATPETQRVTPASVAASASSTNSTVFSFKLPDTNSSAASSGATFTFTTVKDSTVSAAADSSVPASGTVPQNMPTISFSAPAFDVRTSSTAASTSSVTFTSSFSSVSVGTATCSNSTIGATSSTIFQPFTFSSTFVPNKSSIETSIFPISKQSSDAASVTAAVSTAEKVSTAGSKSNFIFGSKVPTTAAAEVKTVVSSPPEQLTSRSEAKTITVSPVVGEVNKSVETILTPPVVKNETVQQQQEVKTERVSGKAEEKEESDKKVTSTKETIVTTAAEVVSVVGQETLASKAPTFPQSSATTVFSVSTSNSAVATAFSTSATSPTVSFGMPVSNSGSSIFDRSVPASSTTSANVFSGDRSSIFSQTKATTNSNFFSSVGASTTAFGQPAATTVTSSNIFGQVTMTTSSGSFFGQAGKDDVGQTAKLFGDVLGGGMQQGSVFTPSTSASGNIFGKSAFEKSGVSIFGNTPATTASETASTSIFGNASSNIFSKPSFGQSPTSNSSNIFGQAQPAESNNTFFRQNICNTFGNTSTAAPNQSPFGASTGFNSKPIFGQSLFGQSNTGQNPFERSSSSSIFGGATTASNPFQSSTSSFGSLPPGPFSGGPSTTGQSALGTSQAFQKPLGGFGGAPVFGSVPAPTPSFGAPPTFGGAPTFGSPPHFGNMQKVFGSPQGTFGQSQANAPNFETLANQTADGFANLAQQSQGQAFGGNTFSQGSGFGNNTNFGGSSFSGWRS